MPVAPAVQQQFAFNAGFFDAALANTPDDAWFKTSADGVQPIVWQVGHVAFSLFGCAKYLGSDAPMPDGLEAKYGMGSTPSTDPAYNLSPAELRGHIKTGIDAVNAAAPTVADDALAAEYPDPDTRKIFPTIGYLTDFLMTGHLMYHAGQIGSARKALGMPPLI
ncbi:MAG: DinB family protein [Planctomycetota bacterium]